MNDPEVTPSLYQMAHRVHVLHNRHARSKISIFLVETVCRGIFGDLHEFNHPACLEIHVPRHHVDTALAHLGVHTLPREECKI